MIDLYYLQDLADEAAKKDEPILDFPLPTTTISTSQHQQQHKQIHEQILSGEHYMNIRNDPKKGKGFYSNQDIKAGTLLLVSKPISLVMGWEEDLFDDDDDNDDNDDDTNNNIMNEDEDLMKSNQRNGLLTIRVAKAIQDDPSIWYDQISHLFPRDGSTLPVWICNHAETGMEYERTINELESLNEFSGKNDVIEDIRQRLPFIVRYNCLSVETSPELFVYPDQAKGGHVTLSATALYYLPSYFNHSSKPNVSRWSIGDIIFFVANQDIRKNTELCISYIESELLCENAARRSMLLEMDFEDSDPIQSKIDVEDGDKEGEDDDDEAEGPVISLDVQDELMNMHPLNRLEEINRLLVKASSEESNGGDNDIDDEEDELFWFQCDSHRLRTLLALTYESLGQPTKALGQWKQCIDFSERNFPPNDEAGITHYVQASLTALSLSDQSSAQKYADKALLNHDTIFGGGVNFFRRRYANEMELQLRGYKNAASGRTALDALWPN